MSIRLRLGLWYAGLLGVVLAAVVIVVYAFLTRREYGAVDHSLATVTEHYQEEIERGLDAGVPLTSAMPVRREGGRTELIGTDYTAYGGTSELVANLTVVDADGRVVLDVACPGAEPLAAAPVNATHRPGAFATVDGDGGRLRLFKLPVRSSGAPVGAVQTTVSLAELDGAFGRTRLWLAAAVVGGVAAAAVGGTALAGRALRPVAEVTQAAREIALSRRFGRRLGRVRPRDEVGELARCFDGMLDSLETVYRAQRQFIDDAAHELRAPLTTMTGNIELLERARDLPSWQREAMLSDIRGEAERLARLVGELLLLARADAGQPLGRDRVALDDVLVETVRGVRPLADGVELGIAALEPATTFGDRDRIKQLVLILVENALRYTPSGGRVRVGLRGRDGWAMVEVADTGIGIDAAELPRVFDRFYRGDAARSRDAGGSGLGLAIAKWIAEAHGGWISVESRPGHGTTFTAALPLSREAAPSGAAPGAGAAPSAVAAAGAAAD